MKFAIVTENAVRIDLNLGLSDEEAAAVVADLTAGRFQIFRLVPSEVLVPIEPPSADHSLADEGAA